jgi:AraC-like DNA-binding protein
MASIPSLIVAFGMIFALFFSSLLLAKPCRGGANLYMAGLVLSSGVSICYEILFPSGLYRVIPHLVKIYIPAQFLIGPFLFLYVCALTEPAFRFKKVYALHFLPSLVSIAYLLPFFLEPAAAKIAFVDATVMAAIPSRAEEWVIWLSLQASLWAYTLCSLRLYRWYRRRVEDTVSNLHRYAWNWLLLFLVCVLVLLTAFLVVDALMLTGMPLVAFNPFISVSMTISILYLGWRGLLRLDYISPVAEERAVAAASPQERDENEWRNLFEKVEKAVRVAALFRSPELTLPELADALGYSRTELSKIINLGGEMNFYDFINKLRVEEVQARLRDKVAARGSILDLAFDSGFNTKSTFHASFKRWTGTTPSLYRRQSAAAGEDGIAPGA